MTWKMNKSIYFSQVLSIRKRHYLQRYEVIKSVSIFSVEFTVRVKIMYPLSYTIISCAYV